MAFVLAPLGALDTAGALDSASGGALGRTGGPSMARKCPVKAASSAETEAGGGNRDPAALAAQKRRGGGLYPLNATEDRSLYGITPYELTR